MVGLYKNNMIAIDRDHYEPDLRGKAFINLKQFLMFVLCIQLMKYVQNLVLFYKINLTLYCILDQFINIHFLTH